MVADPITDLTHLGVRQIQPGDVDRTFVLVVSSGTSTDAAVAYLQDMFPNAEVIAAGAEIDVRGT